jgi:hypothetical protein
MADAVHDGQTATTDPHARELKHRLKEATNPAEVWKIIQNVLTDLTRLEIKTVVTREVTGEENLSAQGDSSLTLSTCIDLLQADRTNMIPMRFLQDPTLVPLREFHAEQVKLAQEELQQKLHFVQRLGAAIIEAINASNAAKGT